MLTPEIQNNKPSHRKTILIVLASLLPTLANAVFNIVTSLPLEPRSSCQGFFEPNETLDLVVNNLIMATIYFVSLFMVISIAAVLWKRSRILALLSVPVTFTILLFTSFAAQFMLLGSNPCF